jgi:uncharacterized protein GlcG (DUF336 family)
MRKIALAAVAVLGLAAPARAEEGLVSIKALSPEIALKAAQVALDACRKQGFQVAVAVVDRSGLAQVMLRDRFAGAHTPNVAAGKAWTAVSFRTNTTDLANGVKGGAIPLGLMNVPGVVMVGGGIQIEAGGFIVAGIGVSGAPSGQLDDGCAKAGIDAIQDALNF